MKFFLLCALVLFGSTSLSAQTNLPASAPDISVVKSSWTKARVNFEGKTLILNIGTMTTKVIDWDYVFVDTQTKTELGRRQFTNVASVSPGSQKS